MMSASNHGRQKGMDSGKLRPLSNRSEGPSRNLRPNSGSLTSAGKSNSRSYGHTSDQYGTRNIPTLQLMGSEDTMDYDLHLEDLGSSGSEYTSGTDEDDAVGITGRTADVFGVAEPLTDRSKQELAQIQQFNNPQSDDEDDYMALRQIALMENEADDVDVDSEEENDIMAEIRAEITDKVREEMKSELEMYRKAKANLQKEEQKAPDDLEGVEPKLKEAILKMRKLDKILEKKTKKEKQVKRDRIMLQKRLRDELENLKKDPDKSITVDEKKNTEKFMMLALPSSHNAGISLEYPENPEADAPGPPVTPLFQTQLPDDGVSRMSEGAGDRSGSARSQHGKSGRTTATGTSQSGASSVSGVSSMTTDSSGKPIKRKKKKDFIKRNIQLASDAANTIAMTDDEKKRLEDLLSDIDGLPEIPEEDSESFQLNPAPYQVAVPAGEGFLPSPNERLQLQDIDSQLRMLVPPEDFESIASTTPRSYHSSVGITRPSNVTLAISRENTADLLRPIMGSMLFTRTNLSSLTMIAEGDPGEQVLQDNKEQRFKQEHLKKIEEELDKLTSAVELEMESPSLSETQLNRLLDDCARTMSRVTEETSSMAHSTGRASSVRSSSLTSLYENPPRLPDNVLQQLLTDARKSMSGTDCLSTPNGNSEMVLESLSEDSMRSSRSSHFTDSRQNTRSSLSSRQYRMKESNMQQKPRTPQRPPSTGEDRRPFLPEIDPLGRLSTQKPSQRLNNEGTFSSRPGSHTPSKVYTVRNSFSELNSVQKDEESFDSDSDSSSDEDTPINSPHPPASGRRSTGGGW